VSELTSTPVSLPTLPVATKFFETKREYPDLKEKVIQGLKVITMEDWLKQKKNVTITTIEKDENCSEALGKMKKGAVTRILVMDQEADLPIGFASMSDFISFLVRFYPPPPEPVPIPKSIVDKAQSYAKHCAFDDEIVYNTILKLQYDRELNFMPIVGRTDQSLKGFLHRKDIFLLLKFSAFELVDPV
jgi:CBS domain-containing protein